MVEMHNGRKGRGVHSRGGRGGSRTVKIPVESPKMMHYVQIQQRPRQSPSYIRNNRPRVIPDKDKDNRMGLNSNGGILGNLVKAFGMSVSADAIDNNGIALNGNYYHHKKFKKVTTTTCSTIQVDDTGDDDGKNGMLPINDNTILNSTFPSSSMNLDLRKTSQEIPGALIDDLATSVDKIINNQKLNGATTAYTIKTTSVYKPKFRISGARELESGSSSDPVPVISTSTPLPPARITGDRRLDRQSLDDRISKIIDENQSILSTWPEHLSKRLKSQAQGQSSRQFGGAQLPAPSPTQRGSSGTIVNTPLMMSGGSTTELTPTINSTRTFIFDVNSPLQSPALDLSNSPAMSKKKFSFDNTSIPSFSKYNLVESGDVHTNGICGTGDLSDSSSAASSTQFVVPKKRRRLSPPSTIFCGGEVSEMPVKKSSPNATGVTFNCFQDVDVRVSNCGPSGAKVTIRTNGASSNVLQAQVQAMEFNRLIEESGGNSCSSGSSSNSGSNRNQILSCAPIEERQTSSFASSLNERDFFPLDLNMKSVKPRGRPPRKRKQLNGNEMGTDNLVTPVSMVALPLDLNVKRASSDLGKYSTSSLNGSGNILRNNVIVKVDCGDSNNSEHDIVNNFDVDADTSTEKQLFLQTSMPNPKRPTFLALKPLNQLPRSLSEPGVLPSPETPRGAKAYNQMYINGHAYTYLGFKISTRSSYTCLFKPQPMFISQDTDPKLSMYSNWQARPRDRKAEENNISTNNSSVNGRKSPYCTYVSAKGKNSDTLTVNSPDVPLLFTPNVSRLTILKRLPDEPLSRFSAKDSVPSSTSLPFSSTSNFISDNKLDSQIRTAPSSPSPIDQGNTSSSSGRSNINMKKKSSYRSSKCHQDSSKRNTFALGARVMSSSDSSSADESNYSFSKSEFERRSFNRKDSVCMDGEDQLLMRLHSTSNEAKDATLPSSSRSSPDFSRFDNPRVKIMEGGFESNEDYTYIRGRGRGRYVCEACGIRCKKPSMLRKHLKTHTDLRPYTCKLCNFSFKTKGNLTKHQKSKSHHKKCVGLGIHPNSSRSLAMSGPIFDNNNTSDEDDSGDEDDDNDNDNDNDNGCDSDTYHSNDEDGEGSPVSCVDTDVDHFEKEIAQSLLDLSHLSRFPRSEISSENNSKGKFSEGSSKQRISSYLEDFRVIAMSKESSHQNIKSGSKIIMEKGTTKSSPSEVEAPIDLSVKCKMDSNNFQKRTNGIVKAMGIVGEAQRWEPEEAFLLDGILNLKKVRNNVSQEEEDSSEDITIGRPEVILADTDPEIKAEIPESATVVVPQELETDSNFEYEIKKRCRPGSVDLSENSTITSSCFQVPLSLSPKPVISSASNGSGLVVSQSHRARLHQPWLSPQGSTEETTESTTPRRERTESLNSCITGESSNSGSTSCRDEIESIADSMPPDTTPVKAIVLEKPVGVCSPNSNSKPFLGLMSVKPQAEFRQPSGAQAFIKDEGKAECNICGKTFTRASQLTLHMNIHFLERPFRCDPCGVSFRTKGHLIKHRRSSSHDCKVYLTEAWGVANEENPRPFKCPDCKIAFRIHGHLAKHLRSKMHIMRMECLGKLPFGIYFEMEKSGLNLNEIDTTDCDMSLVSLQNVAKKIYGDTWMERLTLPIEDPV